MKLDLASASPPAEGLGLEARAPRRRLDPRTVLRYFGPLTAGLAERWPDRRAAAAAGVARWWADRSSRERWLIAVLAAVLALVILDRLVWQPLIDARAAAMAEIARDDRIAAQLRVAGPDVARIAAARTGSLSTVVTERAAKAALTIARIEPQGANVAVSLDGVGFDALVDWLAALDRDAGIAVVELKVDRRPDPGVVTAQVTLSER